MKKNIHEEILISINNLEKEENNKKEYKNANTNIISIFCEKTYKMQPHALTTNCITHISFQLLKCITELREFSFFTNSWEFIPIMVICILFLLLKCKTVLRIFSLCNE